MEGSSGNLLPTWRHGAYQAAIGPACFQIESTGQKVLSADAGKSTQRGNPDCEIAISPMFYGLDSATRFKAWSETKDSPISSRMAGLWQNSLFLARQARSPARNIS